MYGGQFTLSTPLIKPNFCIHGYIGVCKGIHGYIGLII